MTIRLNGRSLASVVLARCLQMAGEDFLLAAGACKPHPRPQFVCINSVAIALLRDLFPRVFSGGQSPGYPVEMREVIWSDDRVPSRIRQSDMVVDMGQLTQRLLDDLGSVLLETDGRPAMLEVNPTSDTRPFLSLGNRSLLVTRVDLTRPLEPARSQMESLLDGWIFLAPLDEESALLQAMVAVPPTDPGLRLKEMLVQSSLIAPRVAKISHVDVIPAAPGIHLPLAGDREIFIGGAGIRLDPVSGEGVPFAIRSAILAAGVLTHEGQAAEVRTHYTRRMLTSFLSHLSGCQAFYSDCFSGDPGWRLELQKSAIAASALERAASLPCKPVFQFRLEGFQLVRCDGSTPAEAASQSTVARRQ